MADISIKHPHNFKDLTGKRFGRFLVLKFAGRYMWRGKIKGSQWICECDCGVVKTCGGSELKSGNTVSCGCYYNEIRGKSTITHGMCRSRFYNIFSGIIKRTFDKRYKNYGGRGIQCLWCNFESFRDDMYPSYLQHVNKFGEKNTTIDRIDNNGNYCKENCRWSTYKEQNLNKRTNHLLTFNGLTDSIGGWSEKMGWSDWVIGNRIRRGWSIERTLTTPI
jgi:hypothetical protein